jgi:trehalose synthase
VAELVHPGDAVILHDPQTAGLIRPLSERTSALVWRCHVGVDSPNDVVRSAWEFLLPDVRAAGATVFSRPGYVWEGLERHRVEMEPPVIDAFSPKNADLSEDATWAILAAAGLIAGGAAEGRPAFVRGDGSTGLVSRAAEIVGGPLPVGAPWVTQVSRWDRLKDPVGVIEGFSAGAARIAEAHLVLAGPSAGSVDDDPEGAAALEDVMTVRGRLEPAVRDRVHLALLPMADAEENAAVVNALQRRSAVVVQKSLAEGFGLTVAEAMWKSRPVVASRVGGIQDQIEDGRSGVLVDPVDLEGFGAAVSRLLFDRARAEALGQAARDRICERFLAPRALIQEAGLLADLLRG